MIIDLPALIFECFRSILVSDNDKNLTDFAQTALWEQSGYVLNCLPVIYSFRSQLSKVNPNSSIFEQVRYFFFFFF